MSLECDDKNTLAPAYCIEPATNGHDEVCAEGATTNLEGLRASLMGLKFHDGSEPELLTILDPVTDHHDEAIEARLCASKVLMKALRHHRRGSSQPS